MQIDIELTDAQIRNEIERRPIRERLALVKAIISDLPKKALDELDAWYKRWLE